MIVRRELEPLLANVVEAGDMIFTAGCIADDESLDVGVGDYRGVALAYLRAAGEE